MWLSILLLLVTSQNSHSYFASTWDCRTAPIVHNLTTDLSTVEKDESRLEFSPPLQIQILQSFEESKSITSHELIIERFLFVEQCGNGVNYDWVWRHEIMSDIELGWYMQLTKQKLKDAIFNGQIVLGDEFGRGRTETVKFKTGVQTFKYRPYGEIKFKNGNLGYLTCEGEDYTDQKGNVHKNAVVTVMYKITYTKRQTHTVSGKVPMDKNDGSCVLGTNHQVFCFNYYTGANILAEKLDSSTDESSKCPYLPSREQKIDGFKVRNIRTNSEVFVSKDQKIVLKIMDKSPLCGCRDTFKSNYNGFFIRFLDQCKALSSRVLPASEMDIESHTNVKLDYSLFVSKNYSRYLYDELFEDIKESSKTSIKNFLTMAHKNKLGVFELKKPLFGKLNGEILSVLKCEEKMLEVVEEPSRCTEELQVYENGDNIAYLKPGTGILQNTFIEKTCQGMNDIGKVYKVYNDDKKTQTFQIIQNEKIYQYHGVTGNVMDHSQLFETKLEMDDLLQYPDFRDSGIYSENYLEKRRRELFNDEEVEAATAGINRFLEGATNSGSGKPEELDLLKLIKTDDLLELVLGSGFIQGIMTALSILSYLSGAKFLLDWLRSMLPAIPIMTINMNHNTNTRGIRETQELADVGQERKEDAPPPYDDLSDWDE